MKGTVMLLMLLLAASATGADTLGLSLTDAIRMAQEHSYGIKGSRYDSLGAVYDLKAARSLRFPTLSLNATAFNINKLQSFTISFGPISKTMELGSRDNYQADFRLAVPLYTGGRISNQIGVQRENASARAYSLEAEKLSAAYETRRAYLNLMLARAMAASAEASLHRIDIIKQDVENMYRVGMADSVDILDAMSAYQKGLQIQAQNQTMALNASNILAQLTGLPPAGRPIVPTDSIPQPSSTATSGAPVDSSAIIRPELRAFDNHIRAADLLVSLNKSNYFPTLSGFTGYSVGKPNRDQFNKTWNDYVNVGLALTWDFNLGGKVRNSALSARQEAFSARMSKSRLTEALTLQANLALQNLQYAYTAFTLTKDQYDIATREFRLAREKQRVGQLTTNRLLELETDLTATEELYRASMINYYLAQTEYFYAVGAPAIYGGL